MTSTSVTPSPLRLANTLRDPAARLWCRSATGQVGPDHRARGILPEESHAAPVQVKAGAHPIAVGRRAIDEDRLRRLHAADRFNASRMISRLMASGARSGRVRRRSHRTTSPGRDGADRVTRRHPRGLRPARAAAPARSWLYDSLARNRGRHQDDAPSWRAIIRPPAAGLSTAA